MDISKQNNIGTTTFDCI